MFEYGIFFMYMQLVFYNVLLVICNDYIGMFKFGYILQLKNLDVVIYDFQFCGVIYNKIFKQVDFWFGYSMVVINSFILFCIEFVIFYVSFLKIFSREDYNGRKQKVL